MVVFRKLKFAISHPLSIFNYVNRLVKRHLFLRTGSVSFKDVCLDNGVSEVKIFDFDKFFFGISKELIIKNADKICNHNFDLLGSGVKNFGEPINWQKDFKTGKVWPLDVFYKIKIIYDGSDIKIPWELSRFYHLPNLGKAYYFSKNEKYSKEFIKEILNWEERNPTFYGPNWMNAMEVGIRAANLIIGYYFFKDSPVISQDFKERFSILIHNHANYILNNLENVGARSNHYLSDIIGLIYIGILMPNLKISKKCLEFAVPELEKEIREQVYEDGMDFEASISYHRLVAELFGFSAWLCKLNNIELSDKFWEKLQKMFEFSWYYTKPNGLAPQIGDNDDGRLHLITEDYYNWDKRDHRHLFWLYGEIFGCPIEKFFSKPTSKGFESSGIYIMRNENIYCLIDCGSNGQNGNGGHAHNDVLSFELNVSGKDFIIDPGTYIYTPDPGERNHFRSTRMHNAVMVDNEEQNRFMAGTIFSMKEDAIPKVLNWESGENNDVLEAEHYGYQRLKNPLIHKRYFLFNKNNLLLKIKDSFGGEGIHKLEWNFHLDPAVEIKNGGEDTIILKNSTIQVNFSFPIELKLEIVDDEISPSYGIKLQSKTLRLFFAGEIKNLKDVEFIITKLNY